MIDCINKYDLSQWSRRFNQRNARTKNIGYDIRYSIQMDAYQLRCVVFGSTSALPAAFRSPIDGGLCLCVWIDSRELSDGRSWRRVIAKQLRNLRVNMKRCVAWPVR